MKIVSATTSDKDISMHMRICRGVEACAALPVNATSKDFFERVRGVVQSTDDPSFKPKGDIHIGSLDDDMPVDLFLNLAPGHKFVFGLKRAGQNEIIVQTEISFDDMSDALFSRRSPLPALAIVGRRIDLPDLWGAPENLAALNQWIFGGCAGIVTEYKNPQQPRLAVQFGLNGFS